MQSISARRSHRHDLISGLADGKSLDHCVLESEDLRLSDLAQIVLETFESTINNNQIAGARMRALPNDTSRNIARARVDT